MITIGVKGIISQSGAGGGDDLGYIAMGVLHVVALLCPVVDTNQAQTAVIFCGFAACLVCYYILAVQEVLCLCAVYRLCHPQAVAVIGIGAGSTVFRYLGQLVEGIVRIECGVCVIL